MNLPPTLWLLGLVSLLMDVASEMVYPLLPLFLVSLGAGTATVGLVEGVAEATASLFKVVGGRISDRMGQRRPLLLLGYGLPALFRPLLALATLPGHVLLYRFLDRMAKGLRTAPRDALFAETVPQEALGRAYGLHRGLDTLGAPSRLPPPPPSGPEGGVLGLGSPCPAGHPPPFGPTGNAQGP